MTNVRERHGARSFMARNSTESLVATMIWSREDLLFYEHQHGVNPPFITWKCGVMLYQRGGVLIDLLYRCTTVLSYIAFSPFPADCACIRTCDTRKKFASPNPCIALLSQRLLFREGCPRKLAQLVICSGRLDWRGYYHLKPHDRLSTYYSSPI